MSLSEKELDLLIKQQITKELEQINVPPVNEQWEQIRARIEAQNNNQGIFHISKFRWIALILVIIGSLSLMFPSQVVGLGKKIFNSITINVGKTTENLITSAKRNNQDSELPYAGPAKEMNITENLTIEDAQNKVDFKITQPEYLPENTKLEEVTFTEFQEDLYRLTMIYIVNDQLITFTQRNMIGDNTDSIVYDVDDSSTEIIAINGDKGTKITSKNGVTIILWQKRGLALELSSKLPPEDLIKIASSVK